MSPNFLFEIGYSLTCSFIHTVIPVRIFVQDLGDVKQKTHQNEVKDPFSQALDKKG